MVIKPSTCSLAEEIEVPINNIDEEEYTVCSEPFQTLP